MLVEASMKVVHAVPLLELYRENNEKHLAENFYCYQIFSSSHSLNKRYNIYGVVVTDNLANPTKPY